MHRKIKKKPLFLVIIELLRSFYCSKLFTELHNSKIYLTKCQQLEPFRCTHRELAAQSRQVQRHLSPWDQSRRRYQPSAMLRLTRLLDMRWLTRGMWQGIDGWGRDARTTTRDKWQRLWWQGGCLIQEISACRSRRTQHREPSTVSSHLIEQSLHSPIPKQLVTASDDFFRESCWARMWVRQSRGDQLSIEGIPTIKKLIIKSFAGCFYNFTPRKLNPVGSALIASGKKVSMSILHNCVKT